MTVPLPNAPILFDLFGKVVPPQFFDELRERLGLQAQGIYTLAVVVWLMMWQRLDGRGTLAVAVQQVVQGVLGAMLPPDKRVREGRVSSNPGALCRARQRMPLEAAEAVCDEVFTKLTAAEPGEGLRSRLFLLDGSSMRTAHTPSLVAAYPPGSNQKGEGHWPVIRVLMAYQASSGLVARPCWGPMYGQHAVSEQALTKPILERIPKGSAVMADINFGLYSVAWDVPQSGCDMLFRLQPGRARTIAGGSLPPVNNSERRVEWRPSRDDRRAHPELPADAVIRGRLIVAQVNGKDGKSVQLYLFTTLEEPWEEVVELYRRRWDVELDIRSLKQTLRMHSLSSKSPEGVEKELLLATAGYNLVRSVQVAAARQANLKTRRLSFSRVQAVVMTALPRLATTTDAAQWEKEYQQLLRWAAQGKLPNRGGPRSFERALWGKGAKFPSHKRAP